MACQPECSARSPACLLLSLVHGIGRDVPLASRALRAVSPNAGLFTTGAAVAPERGRRSRSETSGTYTRDPGRAAIRFSVRLGARSSEALVAGFTARRHVAAMPANRSRSRVGSRPAARSLG